MHLEVHEICQTWGDMKLVKYISQNEEKNQQLSWCWSLSYFLCAISFDLD